MECGEGGDSLWASRARICGPGLWPLSACPRSRGDKCWRPIFICLSLPAVATVSIIIKHPGWMLNMLCRATQLKHVGLIAGIGILYLDGATATRIPRYIGTIYQTSPSGSKKKGPPWCWCCIQATAFNIYQTLTDYIGIVWLGLYIWDVGPQWWHLVYHLETINSRCVPMATRAARVLVTSRRRHRGTKDPPGRIGNEGKCRLLPVHKTPAFF